MRISNHIHGLTPFHGITHNSSLEESVSDDRCTSDGIRVAEFHGFIVVVGCIVDTPHHTLIITKEEDTETGHAVDCDQKTSLLELMHDIGFWDDIHSDGGGDLVTKAGCVYRVERCVPSPVLTRKKSGEGKGGFPSLIEIEELQQ